jgi:hypothetical protein
MGEWGYSSTHTLPSALDGGEWSASHPDRFTPRERAPGTHWLGGWVALDTVSKGKVSNPRQESNPRSSDRPAPSQSLYRLSYPGWLSLYRARWIQPTSSRPIILRSILILSSHQSVDLSRRIFPSGFQPPNTSSLLGPKFSSAPCSQTPSICSSFSVWEHATNENIFLCIFLRNISWPLCLLADFE